MIKHLEGYSHIAADEVRFWFFFPNFTHVKNWAVHAGMMYYDLIKRGRKKNSHICLRGCACMSLDLGLNSLAWDYMIYSLIGSQILYVGYYVLV